MGHKWWSKTWNSVLLLFFYPQTHTSDVLSVPRILSTHTPLLTCPRWSEFLQTSALWLINSSYQKSAVGITSRTNRSPAPPAQLSAFQTGGRVFCRTLAQVRKAPVRTRTEQGSVWSNTLVVRVGCWPPHRQQGPFPLCQLSDHIRSQINNNHSGVDAFYLRCIFFLNYCYFRNHP